MNSYLIFNSRFVSEQGINRRKILPSEEAWAGRSIWEVTEVDTCSSQYTVTSTVLEALQLEKYTFPKKFCRFTSV